MSVCCIKHLFNIILRKFMRNCFQIATIIAIFASFLKNKDKQSSESVERIWFYICSGGWFQPQAYCRE